MNTPLEQPELKDELDRKAIDYLLDLVHRLESGRVSPEIAVAQAGAVWTIVAGLASQDVCQLAEKVANETTYKADSKSLYAFNEGSGQVIRIKWAFDKPGIFIRHWGGAGPASVREVACADETERREKLKVILVSLNKAGYIII